jgi:NAD(P)H-flavin reductase
VLPGFFAPVQSIIEDMLRRQVNRPIRLYFGARTPEMLYRHDLAQRWVSQRPGLVYVPVVSAPSSRDAWTGRTGRLHEAVLQDLPSLRGHEVYACGAPAMVATAREAFERHGLDPSRFFCDAFAPSSQVAA